jgi:TolB-like protein/cytochrome c-type biogenesis protein CcmH/NrfG
VELKRRSVFKVGVVYLAAAWILLQVVATVAPMLTLPAWFERAVLLLLAIGFPVALILAWAFELTSEGVQRDRGVTSPSSAGRNPIDYVVVLVLGVALVYFVADKFFWSQQAPEEPLERSIAVLPFTNMTMDEQNDPFTDGIHDDLLTQLSRIASLKTTSRTSVLQYKATTKTMPEIGAELGVATILEAGVQRSGDRVRINVQLIDAAADEHLWAEQYDRELTASNVFEIQSEIATAIAAQLQAALTLDDRDRLDKVPTQNIAALETYFVGKMMLEDRTTESLQAAIEYFEKVVELDPQFALGWSGLADGYMLLPEYSASVDRDMVESRARLAVTTALQIDPDLPEVQATRAWYELRFFDWDEAERIFRAALAISPDNTNVLHWLSHVLAFQGQFEEAISLARRAVAVDPDSNTMRTNLAYILVDARQYDEGLEVAWAMRETAPEYIVQRRNLFLHELRAGLPSRAAETFVAFTLSTGGDGDAAREIGDLFIAYAETGHTGNITADLISRARLGSEDLAQVLAFVGDSEGAISALQSAAAEHSGSRSVFSMKINPAYDFIREDSRFIRLLEEVGLAE